MVLGHHAKTRALATLVSLTALMNITSAWLSVEPRRMEVLHRIFPLEVTSTSRLATAAAGVALLILSRALARGKRVAWLITVTLLLGSLPTHLLKGLDVEEALGDLVPLLLLLACRDDFRAESDRPSVLRGLLALVGALAVALIYGVMGFYLLDRHFGAHFDLSDSLRATLQRFLLDTGLEPVPVSYHGRWFLNSLDVIGLLALSYGGWSLLRPVVWRQTVAREEREKVRELARVHATSSLARFALFPDKVYHFAPDNAGAIAFRPEGRVALALGDPLGPPEIASALIDTFLARARRCDWVPAFYQVSETSRPAFEANGMHYLKIGEEATIPLPEFTLTGSHWSHERNRLRQFARQGRRLVLHAPPHTPEFLRQLKQVSDDWLAERQGGEKGWALGSFELDYLQDSEIAALIDGDGRCLAFVNLIGQYRRPGMAVDLMRHLRRERGIMDVVILETARLLREKGCAELNLGLAPLAGVGESLDASIPEKGVRFLYRHLNRFYSFRGLRTFKEKFRPCWEPRYLAYRRLGDLPRVAVALARADSGRGLLSYLRKT